MPVLEDVVRRWSALSDHVEREGSATDDKGTQLEEQLLRAAGEFFYTNGVPDEARTEQAREILKDKLTIKDAAVWLAVPELVDGDGRIVLAVVHVSVPCPR